MAGTQTKTKAPANKKALEVSLLAAVRNNQIQDVKDCIEQLSVQDPEKSFLNLIDNESKKTLLQISYPLATREVFTFLLNQGSDPDQGDIAHKINLVLSVIRDKTHTQFPQVLAAITEINYESYRINMQITSHPHIIVHTVLQVAVVYSSLDSVVRLLQINSVSPLETTPDAISSPLEISIVLREGEIFSVFLATEKVKSELFNDESSLLTKIGKIANVDIINQLFSVYPDLKQRKYYEKILKEANNDICKAFLPELIALPNSSSSSDVDWVQYLEENDNNDKLFNEVLNSINFPIEALLTAGQSEKISRKHKEPLLEKLAQSLEKIHDNIADMELLLEVLTISPLRRSIVELVIKKMPKDKLSEVTAEESKHIFWLLLNDDDYEYRFINNNVLRYRNTVGHGNWKVAFDAYEKRYGHFSKQEFNNFYFENVAIATMLQHAGLKFQLEGKPPQNIRFPNQKKSFAREDCSMIDNVFFNSNSELITWTVNKYPHLLVEASEDALLIKTCYKNQFGLDTSAKDVKLINEARIFPMTLAYQFSGDKLTFFRQGKGDSSRDPVDHSFTQYELEQLKSNYDAYQAISPRFQYCKDFDECKGMSDYDLSFTVVRKFSVPYYDKVIVPASEKRRLYLNLMSALNTLEDTLIPSQRFLLSKWKQYDVLQMTSSAKFKDFCTFINAVAGYEDVPNPYGALSVAVKNDPNVNTDIPQEKSYSSIKKDILIAFKKLDECQMVLKGFKQYCEKLSLVEDSQPKNSNSMTRDEVIKQLRIQIARECDFIEGNIIVVSNAWDANDKEVVENLDDAYRQLSNH